MIKGCHKQIVFLKNTGSELFEEAYFILKPNAYNKKEDDIILEATRIIGEATDIKPKKRNVSHTVSRIACFILGAIIGGGGAMLINLII